MEFIGGRTWGVDCGVLSGVPRDCTGCILFPIGIDCVLLIQLRSIGPDFHSRQRGCERGQRCNFTDDYLYFAQVQ